MNTFYSNISFQGRYPCHVEKGIHITPISKDLSIAEIENCLKSISPQTKIGSGANGDVFSLGMDLVIKKARPDALVNNDLIDEAEKLDMLYEIEQKEGMKFKNVQSGIARLYLGKSNESYLISTRIEGAIADANNNPFNEKNLTSLMETLTELDKGSPKKGKLMMYDLNLGNINITKDKAGIFDFEYLRNEYLDKLITERVCWNDGSNSCHISDTSNLESNVRSFEFAGLYNYIHDMPEPEIKDFFTKYLKIKSKYHKNMSDYYKESAKEYEKLSSKFMQELSKIADSELAHSNLLANPDKNIIKSEAMKIQMANFVFNTSTFCKSTKEFNPKQITDYYENGIKFFCEQHYNSSQNSDNDRKIYYKNCMNLYNGWGHMSVWPCRMFKAENNKIKTLDEFVL